MMPTPLWNMTCDIYRPFGDSTPTTSGVVCRLVPDFARGQMSNSLTWTHYLDLPAETDVRDSCARSEGSTVISFADGDEVRVSSVRYVVVWVESHNGDRPGAFRRVFLVRHDPAWPA